MLRWHFTFTSQTHLYHIIVMLQFAVNRGGKQPSTCWAEVELVRTKATALVVCHTFLSVCSAHCDDERSSLLHSLLQPRLFGGKRDQLPKTDSVRWNERSLLASLSFFFFSFSGSRSKWLKWVTELEQTGPHCPCPKVTGVDTFC